MTGIGAFIINWVDLVWFPVAGFAVTRRQRPYALFFVLCCALTLRLQSDLMHAIGFDTGLTQMMPMDVRARGLLIYGIFTVLYLTLMHFSRRQPGSVLLSTTIAIFTAAFILSMTLMAI